MNALHTYISFLYRKIKTLANPTENEILKNTKINLKNTDICTKGISEKKAGHSICLEQFEKYLLAQMLDYL